MKRKDFSPKKKLIKLPLADLINTKSRNNMYYLKPLPMSINKTSRSATKVTLFLPIF